MIFGSELDENDLGRIPGVHLRKVHRMALVVFVNDKELRSVGTIHFAEVLETWERYSGSRWIGRGARPWGFDCCGGIWGVPHPHDTVQLAE